MNPETLNKVMNAVADLAETAAIDPFGKYLQITEVIRHAESIQRAERKLYAVLERVSPRNR